MPDEVKTGPASDPAYQPNVDGEEDVVATTEEPAKEVVEDENEEVLPEDDADADVPDDEDEDE